jgi:hypothetical protein
MKLRYGLKSLQRAVAVLIAGLLLTSSLLADPPHGRGRGRDRRDRKERKFINGHDARDGRWDGRGPRNRRGGGWDDDCRRCDDDDRGRNRRWPRRWPRRW